jgi:hypothetical protein
MKKLQILKAIIDFLWIISMPAILMIIGLVIVLFFSDLGDLNLKINSVNFNSNDIVSKTLLAISALNYLLIITALYFFRKALHMFLRVKIFDDIVIKSFHKIGNLLAISGIISLTIALFQRTYFEQKVSLELGLNQHVIIICLGLFFMVLSEIFKIAKNTKQENDLTI